MSTHYYGPYSGSSKPKASKGRKGKPHWREFVLSFGDPRYDKLFGNLYEVIRRDHRGSYIAHSDLDAAEKITKLVGVLGVKAAYDIGRCTLSLYCGDYATKVALLLAWDGEK